MLVLKALILLGAALMVANIYYYVQFMRASDQLFARKPQLKKWRTVGLLLLVFFLVGYLIMALRDTSTIMALVLFFGSVYVSVALQEMMDLTNAQRQIMDDAVDDAKDTEVKTGLYTLNGFSRHVVEEVRAHPDTRYMVVQWDIDEFKVYNDINGYTRGDEILKEIGRESPQHIASGIVFGHLNADHFVVLAESSDKVASEIHSSIKSMLQGINGGTELGFHMGICAINGPDDSIASACDHALIALRTIKDQYQVPYAWYSDRMKNTIIEEHRLVAEMEDALADGQFQAWFQPQVDYQSGKVTGAEALVRWIHPERGIVPPFQFIPLFEKNGFIVQLDKYVWEQVCKFQRDWIDAGHEAYPISINISRRDIFGGDVTDFIISLVEKYRLDPSLLHLEITESVYMASPEKLNEVVGVLQDYGFTVEMDDFGSGYSSLNTLKDMKVDTIKLDMKFLQQSENSDRSGRIISAMIRMADWLDVATLAEGVETKEQADFLKSMGCSHMQGYYFFKPMSADDYRKLLSRPGVAIMNQHTSREYLEGALDFMDSSAQATLVFNSFTGNAMIADYHHGMLELLRINEHLAQALGSLKDDFNLDKRNVLDMLEPDQRAIFVEALDRAVEEHDETQCVVRVRPTRKGQTPRWLSLRMRVISSRGSSAVLYFSVEDITIHWQLEKLEAELEKIFENVPGGIMTFE
ncbi:MAG: EAL domain-containing protein, partial [Coriobacteriales bacterium]|nr:EAL domain-containing protein [Coriobacteriales bacterium]